MTPTLVHKVQYKIEVFVFYNSRLSVIPFTCKVGWFLQITHTKNKTFSFIEYDNSQNISGNSPYKSLLLKLIHLSEIRASSNNYSTVSVTTKCLSEFTQKLSQENFFYNFFQIVRPF